MPRCRFVQPDVVRLALSEGDFLDVKRELNAGEVRRLFAQMVTRMPIGGGATLNPEQVGKTKLLAYLIGWSFVDIEGRPVPVTEGALDGLDLDTYNELVTAIDAHEAQIERLRAEKKTAPAGVRGS